MNPISNTSPATAATIAFTTNVAGPSFASASKTDAIAESKTCLRPSLRPLLVRRVRRRFLSAAKPPLQLAAVRLRREASNLVDLREILRSRREEDSAACGSAAPSQQRKIEFSQPGGFPFRSGVRKMASCLRHSRRPRPFIRQVQRRGFTQRQDSRVAIPIPVLPISEFHRPHPPGFAPPETVVHIEERFASRYHRIVACSGAAHGHRAPS